MNIGGFLSEIKTKIKTLPRHFLDDIFLVVAIFLIALASFGIGRLSVLSESPKGLEITYLDEREGELVNETGKYVASITGSKYHLPWCPGAKSIKEENKVWFDSKESAEISGYAPAINCPGL